MEKLGQIEKVIKLWGFGVGVLCVCVFLNTSQNFLQLNSAQPFLLFDLCSVGETRHLLSLPAPMLQEVFLELFFGGEVKNGGLR